MFSDIRAKKKNQNYSGFFLSICFEFVYGFALILNFQNIRIFEFIVAAIKEIDDLIIVFTTLVNTLNKTKFELE